MKSCSTTAGPPAGDPRPPVAYAPFALSERVDEVLDVQARANGFSPAELEQRRQIVLSRAREPGVRAVGAFCGGRLVGFAFGGPLDPHWWWSAQVRSLLRTEPRLASRGVPFTVLELHVDPSARRRGIGSALMERLCRSADRRWVVLTRRADATAARRFYLSLGFADLSDTVIAGGYQVMFAERADEPAATAIAPRP